jgi:hypothetical protein
LRLALFSLFNQFFPLFYHFWNSFGSFLLYQIILITLGGQGNGGYFSSCRVLFRSYLLLSISSLRLPIVGQLPSREEVKTVGTFGCPHRGIPTSWRRLYNAAVLLLVIRLDRVGYTSGLLPQGQARLRADRPGGRSQAAAPCFSGFIGAVLFMRTLAVSSI